jgi:hypothetical protein
MVAARFARDFIAEQVSIGQIRVAPGQARAPISLIFRKIAGCWRQGIDKAAHDEAVMTPLTPYIEALAQVRAQDLESTQAGGVRIRQSVAPDRRISIKDAESRHGRKIKSKRFDGYKEHIARDLDAAVILACSVTSANRPEEDNYRQSWSSLAAMLHYRAGSRALARLRSHGLPKDALSALVLPATGPRWLVSVGFDRALIEGGWLGGGGSRILLLGASVGSWRALAMAARDPTQTHAKLVDAYCEKRFVATDDSVTVSNAYRSLLHDVFSEDDLACALNNRRLDLAIATARVRGAAARPGLRWTLIATGLMNAASSRAREMIFERTIFHTAGDPSRTDSMVRSLQGRRCALTMRNVRDVALASGTVPMYMDPVHNIDGAPEGAYLDGALCDYHLNQSLHTTSGVVILFLHQRRIIPSWLDKHLPWRTLRPQILEDLLLIYPSRQFVRSLPGGTLPSREDFVRFVHDPERRIAMWREAVTRSAELGACFREDAASSAVASVVRPI